MSRARRFAGLAASALVLTAVLALVGAPSESRLWETIFDCGHAVVFGLFAVVAVTLLDRRGGHLRAYLDAFGIAVVLGLATEVVQHFVGRDAELQDVVRDAVGALACLLVHAAITGGPLPRGLSGRLLRAGAAVLGAALLTGAVAPALVEAWAFDRRDRAFPRLAVFEERWSRTFVELHDATLAVGPAPAGWSGAAGRPRARMTMHRGQYPGFALKDPSPDWTGWDRLVVSLFNPGEEAFPMILRVDDADHDGAYDDRFNRTFTVEPGPNVLEVPLAEIRDAPRERAMDLSRIRRIVFFAERPRSERSLWLGEWRLERDGGAAR